MQSPLRRITNTSEEGININPSMSGDGRVVAFESTEDVAGAGGLESFRAIRANISVDPATFLQMGGTRAPGAGISQDGSSIVFASKDDPLGTNGDRNSEIFLYDGTQLIQVTDTSPGDLALRAVNGNYLPSISDDGRFIAFSSNRDFATQNPDANLEIFIFDSVAASFTQLTNSSGIVGFTDAKISGDGASVAYIRDNGATPGVNRDLVLRNRVGPPSLRTLTTDAQNLRMTFGRAISDDGKRVVWSAETATNSSQVFLYDGRNNETRQITSLGTRVTEVPLHPTISGNGSRIAFATRRSVSGAGRNSDGSVELYTYEIPSGTFGRVTDTPSNTATAEVLSSMNDDGSIVAFNFPRVLTGVINEASGNNSEIYVTETPARPAFGELTVQNGASFGHEPATSEAVAPDSVAVALGTRLSNTTEHSQQLPDGSFPSTVGGTTVTVNGRRAQIFYVSPTQINFHVPAATELGTAEVIVTNSDGFPSRDTVESLLAAPGVFTFSGDGVGEGVVLDADTLQPGPFNPTSGDLRLIVFSTGVRNGVEVSVTAGGRALTVESIMPSPNMPGLDEVHVLVPADLRGAGQVNLVIRADGHDSNPVTVTFVGNPRRDIVLNELLSDPPGTAATDLNGDANHDGTRSASQDEFVELVNTTTHDIDISSYELATQSSTADSETLRHTFASGTILPACTAIVVFGGGSPDGNNAIFGGAQIIKASSGSLSLSNSGGVITLRDSTGTNVNFVSYGSSTGLNGNASQSLTRSPDISGGFILHQSASGSGNQPFSPGTRVTGAAFNACQPPARIEVSPSSATIAPGSHQQFTARAFNANNQPLGGVIFEWHSSNTSVAAIDANGLATSVDQGTSEITATARGVQSDPSTLIVRGGPPPVVISEFRTRGPGGASDEFIEIYNNSDNPINISGWKIKGSNSSGSVGSRLTINTGTTLPARMHFLATHNSYSGSILGDQTYSSGITNEGGIALTLPNDTIVDQVGLSAGSVFVEGMHLAPLPSNADQSYERKPGGASGSTQDTNDNFSDFQLLTPSHPQNLSSSPTPGGPTPTPSPTASPTATPSPTASPTPSEVVISQVYGGGGNSVAPYNHDFVEIFNGGSSSVDITAWSVQQASAAASSWSVTPLCPVGSCTLAPGQYFLVQEGSGGANGTALPAPDATGTASLAAGSGKIALVNSTSALSGSGCSLGSSVVDFVGYGATASCFEGTGRAPAPSNTRADFRKAGGCIDTNDNAADFLVAAPGPRNTSSPINDCNAPPPPDLSIDDVIVIEGNSGTVTASFTVSLSAPAPAGGVTFNIATQDDTATAASNDYLAKSLISQSIPAGQQTYTFNVTVNGDTAVEANETFFVNITSVAGANVSDGQGLGTIQNDDAANLVISQLYGGGGNSAAVYLNDFVEIFNRGTTSVDFAVTPYSIQYAGATSNFGSSKVNLTSGAIAPGGYYLVKLSGGANGAPLPPPDASGSITLAASAGKVALVVGTVALHASTCPGDDGAAPFNPNSANIVDFIGYGSTPICYEGSAHAPAPGNTKADFRNAGGCTDTNDNAADFLVAAPGPRNTASPINDCNAPPTLTSVTISPLSATIGEGETTQFTGQALDQHGLPIGGVTVTFASNNTTVATIDSVTPTSATGSATSDVTGHVSGSAEIRATANNGSGTTVTSSPASLIVEHLAGAGDVLISEFRTRGPSGTSDEFIEFYNPTTSTVSIGGLKIIGSNGSGGTSTRATIAAGTTLGSGCHYLLAHSAYSGSVTADQTYGTSIADTGGIAIIRADGTTILDQVGMSNGSAYKEGTPLARLTKSVEQSYERKPGGAAGNGTDTDNNFDDFFLNPSSSNPQNLSSGCLDLSKADLTIAKTDSPDPVTTGSNVTYTIVVTNNGAGVAQSVVVTDNLPANVSFVSCASTGSGVCGGSANNRTITFSSLASGDSETITLVAKANSAGGTTISNTASVSSATSDPNAANNSDTETTNVEPVFPIITIADVSAFEGDSGSTVFTFTVHLSTVAPAGGSTFDITTADDSAQDHNPPTEDSDYIAKSLSNQTIPAGQQDYQFTVTVNGDKLVEPDETFFVNVTPVSNATLSGGDGQGIGTIQNDDTASLVISQVYGGGGNSGAPFTHDFIELFNRGTTTVNFGVTHYSVQYASPGSNFGSSKTDLTSGTILPGEYFLIQESGGTTNGVALPTPEATGTIAMGSTSGKVALVANTLLLPSEICPGDDGAAPFNPNNAAIIDFVGYGSTPVCYEGSAQAPAPSNTKADFRNAGGCTDTNDNAADFLIAAPGPRNTSSPLNDCSKADLAITKSDSPDPVTTGSNVTYTITVTNNGPAVAQNLVVTDNFPAGVAFVSCNSTGGGVCDGAGNNRTVTFSSLAGGASATITLVATANSPAGTTVTNTATVASSTSDSNAANNSATSTTAVQPVLPVLSIDDVSIAEGNSGTTTATFSVTLSPSSTQTVMVDYATSSTSPATAAAGSDYQATNGTLTFNPGQTSLPVTVTINGDTLAEADETFFVELTGATNANISDGHGVGTITNDDAALIVISQLYGGGGNSSAPAAVYKNDYIEVFNPGASTVELAGWSVQYSSSAGASWSVTPLCPIGSCLLLPGQYFLVQEAQGAGGTADLPNPDAVGTIGMATTSGKVAVVSSTTALSGACPADARILDLVGYGGATSCFEGAGAAPSPGNITADLRANNGCVDTDQNAADFAAGSPNPRNSASPLNDCSAADLAITKTDSPDPVTTGSDVTYTITVTNNGPAGAQSVVVTDNLSANVSFVSCASTGSGVCGGTGNNRTITFSLLPSAASATITLVATANGAGGTSITNTATVSSATTDPNNANNSDTETTNVQPILPIITIADVSTFEGDSGTTIFTFTVHLSTVAPAGGSTFDITTADDSAQDHNPPTEDSDYVAKSLSNQTIPAGQQDYQFTVTVNGDKLVEPDETFFVNVTPVSNATLSGGDGQGIGTIQNDDTASLVISQVYGGGNNSGAPYQHDFIEVFNRGTTTVNFGVTHYSVQYASPGSNFGSSKTDLTSGTILPGEYFLIQESGGTTNGVALPTPEATGTIAMGSTSGKVALVANTLLLPSEICPGDDGAAPFNPNNAAIIDFVGYGAVSCYEGPTGAAPAPSNTTADFRKSGGCTDSDNNADDFLVAAPGPRNNASAINDCNTADLSITKTDSPDPVITGSDVTFAITVTNLGPGTAQSVVVSDDLPAEVTFVSCSSTGSGNCAGSLNSRTITFASLLSGASETITLVANVNGAGGTTITNTATVTSSTTDPTPGNNSAQSTTSVTNPASADLSISKTDSPDPVAPGATLTYTLTLINGGPDAAQSVVVTDNLPSSVAFVDCSSDEGGVCGGPSSSPTISFSSLANSATATITIHVTVSSSLMTGVVISNTVSVTSATADPSANNNTDSEDTTVDEVSPGEVLISEFRTRGPSGTSDEFIELYNPTSSAVSIGGLKIIGSNASGGTSTRATVTAGATLGSGCHYLLGFHTTSCTNCYSGSVTPDQTYGLSIADDGGIAITRADGSTILDQVGMSTGSAYKEGTHLAPLSANMEQSYERKPGGAYGNGTDTNDNVNDFFLNAGSSNPQNSSSGCIDTSSADLSITKTDTPDPVAAGSDITYTINVINNGPATASDLTLSDSVPLDTTFVSLASPVDWSCTAPSPGGTGAINCTTSTLALQTATLTLIVKVNAGVPGGTVVSNTATVSSSTPDANSLNNSITQETTVQPSADLSVTKADSSDPAPSGAQLSYTITVTNNSLDAAQSVTVTDNLPADVTFVSCTSSGTGTCGGTGNNRTVSFTSIAGNTSETVSLVVRVNHSAAGTTISNTATVASTGTSDPNASNDSATQTTAVILPSLVISYIYGGGGANTGSPSFTRDFVEIFNRGSVAISLSGLSLQQGATTGNLGGNAGQIYALCPGGSATCTVSPGQYYLIETGATGTAGASLSATVTPDDTGGAVNFAATNGKGALVTGTSGLSCGATATLCSAAALARIVDLVGYGTGTTQAEGSPAGNLSTTTAARRKLSGCQDTNVNSADFDIVTPTAAAGNAPRHMSSLPLNVCL